jgi:FkbM family methyltransferase
MFDIGANIGYYTLLMASLVDGRGEVHAFEPWPEVFDWLAHNAELNHFRSLNLQKKAVSDTDGKQPLFLPSNRHWTNASLVEGFTTQGSCFDIETVRLDTYCRTREIQHIDLVKIDVEGAELKVLQGMGELIDRWSPDIVCEVLSGYEDELDAFLAGSAYRKFLITDNGLEEVDKLQAHATFRDYYLSCNPINCLP